ncbi:MAG: hypothetical protein ACK4TA_18255, partial [Saprospiraceae bacterium]
MGNLTANWALYRAATVGDCESELTFIACGEETQSGWNDFPDNANVTNLETTYFLAVYSPSNIDENIEDLNVKLRGCDPNAPPCESDAGTLSSEVEEICAGSSVDITLEGNVGAVQFYFLADENGKFFFNEDVAGTYDVTDQAGLEADFALLPAGKYKIYFIATETYNCPKEFPFGIDGDVTIDAVEAACLEGECYDISLPLCITVLGPEAGEISGSDEICAGDELDLTIGASTGDFVLYIVFDNDGEAIASFTSETDLEEYLSGLEVGDYCLKTVAYYAEEAVDCDLVGEDIGTILDDCFSATCFATSEDFCFTVSNLNAGTLSSDVEEICEGGSVDLSIEDSDPGQGGITYIVTKSDKQSIIVAFNSLDQVEDELSILSPGTYCVYALAYVEFNAACFGNGGYNVRTTIDETLEVCLAGQCYDLSEPLCITVNRLIGNFIAEDATWILANCAETTELCYSFNIESECAFEDFDPDKLQINFAGLSDN